MKGAVRPFPNAERVSPATDTVLTVLDAATTARFTLGFLRFSLLTFLVVIFIFDLF